MRTGLLAMDRRVAVLHRGASVLIAFLALGASAPARAQAAPPSNIYTCVDAAGKRLTSDRFIPECSMREQRVLNADGSTKRVVPPALTADERGDLEARERANAQEKASRQDAVRRDRNMLARFPNEAAHRKAREAALDDGRKSLRLSEARLAALAVERKPLIDEAEFYVGKPLPAKLKAQIEAIDVAEEAQRTLVQNQELEVTRIDQLYDAELERLKKLWQGAQPGSLGALAGGAASAPRK